MRRVLFIALLAAAIVAVALFLIFGINQKSEEGVEVESPSSTEGESAETLTTAEATELADRLVSQDETTYATTWSHENIPPVSPEGTTIVVNTVESGESAAVIDVTFTTPNADTVGYYLLVQLVGDQWRIYSMEAK